MSNTISGTMPNKTTGNRFVQKSNGDMYFATVDNRVDSYKIAIYKSTDSAQTWNKIDYAATTAIGTASIVDVCIVIDSSDIIHCAYTYDPAGSYISMSAGHKYTRYYSGLAYRTLSGDIWSEETVILSSQYYWPYYLHMYFDQNNELNILSNTSGYCTYLSTLSGGAWSTITLYTENYFNRNSVVLDSTKHAHIVSSFTSYYGVHLKDTIVYTTNISGSYVINKLTLPGYSYNPVSAIDSTGAIHTIWEWKNDYNDTTEKYKLRYTKILNGVVVKSELVGFFDGGDNQSMASIVIDPLDTVHVVFMENIPNTSFTSLKYCSCVDGEWGNFEVKIDGLVVPQRTCLYVYSNKLYIYYYESYINYTYLLDQTISTVATSIVSITPTHPYKNQIVKIVSRVKNVEQVQYKLNVNGIDFSDFNSLSANLEQLLEIPNTSLTSGTNKIVLNSKDSDNNTGSYISKAIKKEELYRTTSERTFLKIDGGYNEKYINKSNNKAIVNIESDKTISNATFIDLEPRCKSITIPELMIPNNQITPYCNIGLHGGAVQQLFDGILTQNDDNNRLYSRDWADEVIISMVLSNPYKLSTLMYYTDNYNSTRWYQPYNFHIDGSNDTTTGLDGTWDVLKNVVNNPLVTGDSWGSVEVNSPIKYKAYRMCVSMGHDDNGTVRKYLLLREIKLMYSQI